MVINKKTSKKAAVKASNRMARTARPVKAAEEIEEEVVEDADVAVAPEASDLLFEAEDVAELLAEVTGQNVAVTAEEDQVTFEVGEDEYVVEAEEDVETLASTKKPLQNKKAVKASRKVAPRRAVRR
jgi:hypothetical protein